MSNNDYPQLSTVDKFYTICFGKNTKKYFITYVDRVGKSPSQPANSKVFATDLIFDTRKKAVEYALSLSKITNIKVRIYIFHFNNVNIKESSSTKTNVSDNIIKKYLYNFCK